MRELGSFSCFCIHIINAPIPARSNYRAVICFCYISSLARNLGELFNVEGFRLGHINTLVCTYPYLPISSLTELANAEMSLFGIPYQANGNRIALSLDRTDQAPAACPIHSRPILSSRTLLTWLLLKLFVEDGLFLYVVKRIPSNLDSPEEVATQINP